MTKLYNALFYFPKLRKEVLKAGSIRDQSVTALEEDRLLKLAYRKIREREIYKKIRRKDVILWKVLFLKKLVREKGKCEKCGGHQGGLTIDHIIPNFMLKDMGIDPDYHYDERNFRLLCKICNISKGMHLDFTDPRTKTLLLELLKSVVPR